MVRYVYPGEEALEVLEKAGTSKEKCEARLLVILSATDIQDQVFGKRVDPSTIVITTENHQQGKASFTFFISLNPEQGKQFAAQFRQLGEDQTSVEVLDAAASIWGDWVPKPLYLAEEGSLQVVIWKYYGENTMLRFYEFTEERNIHSFTNEQKINAMRQYAEFLALGCQQQHQFPPSLVRDGKAKAIETFKKVAKLDFPPEIRKAIDKLRDSLGTCHLHPNSTKWEANFGGMHR
jgi:hypothetical protein